MRTSPDNKMTQAYMKHHATEDLEAAFQRFVEIVSETKGFNIEGIKPVKNETARLIK